MTSWEVYFYSEKYQRKVWVNTVFGTREEVTKNVYSWWERVESPIIEQNGAPTVTTHTMDEHKGIQS